MTLKEIENFIALADEGSFSRTAKLLFLSQQTLSAQISRIESELGVDLFIRGRNLILTEEGRMFYRTAKEIVKAKNQFEIDIEQYRVLPDSLQIGIQHTTARSIMPNILPRFSKRFPNITVKFEENEPHTTLKALDYNAVDFAIGPLPEMQESYNIVPLTRKSQLLIVPRKMFEEHFGDDADAVAKKSMISSDLKQFEDFPFLKIREGFWAGNIMRDYFAHYVINPRIVMECTNIDVAFHVACAGMGCLIFSRFFYTGIPEHIRKQYSDLIYAFLLGGVRFLYRPPYSSRCSGNILSRKHKFVCSCNRNC